MIDLYTCYALLLRDPFPRELLRAIRVDRRLSDHDREQLLGWAAASKVLRNRWPDVGLEDVSDGLATAVIDGVMYRVPVDYWMEADLCLCTVTGPAAIMCDGHVTGVVRKLTPREESFLVDRVCAHVEKQAEKYGSLRVVGDETDG